MDNDQTKVKSYRNFDPVLQRWFVAPTAEALAALLNLPQFINLRAQRQARWPREREANDRHGSMALFDAHLKRTRKNHKRLRVAINGGFNQRPITLSDITEQDLLAA